MEGKYVFQDGGEPECILPSNALGGRSTIKQNQSRRDQESHVTSPGFRYNDDIGIVHDYLRSAKEEGGEGGMRSQNGNHGKSGRRCGWRRGCEVPSGFSPWDGAQGTGQVKELCERPLRLPKNRNSHKTLVGCSNKSPWIGLFDNNRNLFLTVPKSGSPRLRCWQIWYQPRTPFPGS